MMASVRCLFSLYSLSISRTFSEMSARFMKSSTSFFCLIVRSWLLGTSCWSLSNMAVFLSENSWWVRLMFRIMPSRLSRGVASSLSRMSLFTLSSMVPSTATSLMVSMNCMASSIHLFIWSSTPRTYRL